MIDTRTWLSRESCPRNQTESDGIGPVFPSMTTERTRLLAAFVRSAYNLEA